MLKEGLVAGLALLLLPAPATATEWRAGAANISVTPRQSMRMAGFGERLEPSDGVGLDLYVRALALEDTNGTRVVLVSTDTLGFPATLTEAIVNRAGQRYGVSGDRLLLNASHTHAGPVVKDMLEGAADLTAPERAEVEAYTRELEDKVVAVIGSALEKLAPARLFFGESTASFGVNRRLDAGRRWGPNYAGPADHDVPILRIEDESGQLVAIVFGYGCHPSTLPPSYRKFHGDYAGVAARRLEDRHAGAVALFVMGAGGDVKPFPCDTLELAEKYGELLAATVEHRMALKMTRVVGPLKTAFQNVSLAFARLPTRRQLTERSRSADEAVRRHAIRMLGILDGKGRLPESYPQPVQVWQFGRDLTLIALGGELLADYALRLKRELPETALWVAGYSNDVFAYIPSLRVLEEGGYEGGGAMLGYLQPGPWAPSIEETIIAKAHELVREARSLAQPMTQVPSQRTGHTGARRITHLQVRVGNPLETSAASPAEPTAVAEEPLFFREDWSESPEATPITQGDVSNPDLLLVLHGPGRAGIKKSHHDLPGDDPFYVWSGACPKPWAVSLGARSRHVDLTGPKARIRWRTKQTGARQLRIIVKLSDGRWLVSDKGGGAFRRMACE